MKISLLLGLSLLALGAGLAQADEKAEQPAAALAPLPQAPVMASKTEFLTGLKEPQGLALADGGKILVADYKTGEILQFSREGKPLGVLVKDLQGPAMLVSSGETLLLSERKANRVLMVSPKGETLAVGGEIIEPLGLHVSGDGIYAVAHTTSKIFKIKTDPTAANLKMAWAPIYAAPVEEGKTKRYGYRALAKDPNSSALFLSDEVSGHIFLLTPSGFLSTFAFGFEDPSGLAFGPDGSLYVAEEGKNGQLVRLSPEGKPTVVAQDLGRPRGILFLDAKTVLVSNRDGNVWKLILS